MDINIKSGTWDDLKHYARNIREQVFIQEQHIPENEEWDDLDFISVHFIIFDQGQAIATARLLPNNSIGRVAVLQSYRGLGIGIKLMQEIILIARKEKRNFLKLSAQVQAIPFYEKLGFKCEGVEYLDCNIPHRDMMMDLS